MHRLIAAALFILSACFVAPNETPIGGHTGGGTAGAGPGGGAAGAAGGVAAGQGGGGAVSTELGDAVCDQRTCLPERGDLGVVNVAQMTQDGAYLFAVLQRPGVYLGTLVRIDMSTLEQKVLYDSSSDPVDPGVALKVKDGKVYFGRTWAGEIWGILTSVPVGGGTVQDVFDTHMGGGNPRTGTHERLGVYTLYVSGSNIRIMESPATDRTLHMASSSVRDLAVSGVATVWFIDDTGARSIEVTGRNLSPLIGGDFKQLLADGPQVFALRADGAVVELTSGNPGVAVATFVGAHRIIRVGGRFYAAKTDVTGQGSELWDTSLRLLEAPNAVRSAASPGAFLAGSSQRLFLGTDRTLAWRSLTPPTATCGCAFTNPVLPQESQACARNVCRTSVSIGRTLLSGALDADRNIWGAFSNPTTSGRDLARYHLSGSGGLVFPTADGPTRVIGVDSADVYYTDSVGELRASDRQGNGTRQVGGVVPWVIGVRADGLAAMDATHIYFSANGGLSRVPKVGGQSEMLVPDVIAADIKLDLTHVYFSASGQLHRVPKSGGASIVLTQGHVDTVGFGLSETHVYVLTARGVERVSKAGGFRTLVLRADRLSDLAISTLTIQGGDLVVGTEAYHMNPAGLWRVSLATGERELLLRSDNGYSLSGAIIDDRAYVASWYQRTLIRERGCSCGP